MRIDSYVRGRIQGGVFVKNEAFMGTNIYEHFMNPLPAAYKSDRNLFLDACNSDKSCLRPRKYDNEGINFTKFALYGKERDIPNQTRSEP